MTRRLRVLLAVLLTVVFVGAGSSAAWALWSTTGTVASSVSVGTVSASIGNTTAATTTFSSSVPTVTAPLTLSNPGTLGGTTSTSVAVTGGSSALAAAITVVAWPVASATACTTTTTTGAGAVSGTWASLPSLRSTLSPGAAAVWCVRSTPTSSAPASSTTTITLSLAVTTGSWTSTTVRSTFSMATAAAAPAATCTDHSGNYVDIAWPTSSRPADTWYAAYVNGTMVGDRQQSYYGRVTLAPSQIPATVASSGTITVVVKVLDSAGNPTSTVAGTTPVTLFTQNNGPAIRCGA
ncbi:hypothetical protein [Curtobacterium sp. ISL-83]|uniref:hypothetical protein n=1 Tax=Curtobacterium sp. ISL-83 TaxID=2819145 RepID=UPI001BE90CEE|nr:hypothetical protein [Curtobacterium sp. ISL-83]MBT2503582.1 hypothetical protein [Curtobacterium sp. ISL-83]